MPRPFCGYNRQVQSRTGSTRTTSPGRINSDGLGSWKKNHNIKWNWNFYPFIGLNFGSKMGQIKKDLGRFSISCCVVKLPFCIPGTSISWTRLVHLFTKLIVSVITHFCCTAWFCRNSLYFRLAPYLENRKLIDLANHLVKLGNPGMVQWSLG